jgi:hypothetical protein
MRNAAPMRRRARLGADRRGRNTRLGRQPDLGRPAGVSEVMGLCPLEFDLGTQNERAAGYFSQ